MRAGVRTVIDSITDRSASRDKSIDFDEAFTLHHRAVFSTACAVVRDAAVAEEVTQEVFLKLYRNLDSRLGAELLRPWLLRVTLNEARNTLRGRKRALVRDTTYLKTTAEEVAPEKIKEPMRSCLLLRHQGLSYREIAQTLSLKENYVGSLVARARKEFARAYGRIGVKQ